MSIEIWLAIIGIAVSVSFSVVSLVYARATNREKERLEKYTRTHLDALVETIERTEKSAAWAHHHLESIHGEALNLDRSEGVNNILKFASFGKADSLSAERSIKDLLTQARAVREGWFGVPKNVQHDGAAE